MTIKCSVCGQSVSNASTFCEHCGSRVEGQRRGPSMLKVVGAVCLGIICLPLGACGVLGVFVIAHPDYQSSLFPRGSVALSSALGVCLSALGIFGILKLLKQGK